MVALMGESPADAPALQGVRSPSMTSCSECGGPVDALDPDYRTAMEHVRDDDSFFTEPGQPMSPGFKPRTPTLQATGLLVDLIQSQWCAVRACMAAHSSTWASHPILSVDPCPVVRRTLAERGVVEADSVMRLAEDSDFMTRKHIWERLPHDSPARDLLVAEFASEHDV